ncbi:MAG TPA: hypothetical protein VIT91_03000 [Chthoniobacterales bacterium]
MIQSLAKIKNVSFDIHRFLEEIVETELPKMAMQNAYFGAGILAGGIEFFGACLDAHPIPEEKKSAERFCLALNTLFPAAYHPLSRPAPYTKNEKGTHDLYTSLRCGMAHVLRPQGVFLTGGIAEATVDGNSHLQILTRDGKSGPLIIVEQFAADFVAAAKQLQAQLCSAPLPQKLAGDFLKVWPS